MIFGRTFLRSLIKRAEIGWTDSYINGDISVEEFDKWLKLNRVVAIWDVLQFPFFLRSALNSDSKIALNKKNSYN